MNSRSVSGVQTQVLIVGGGPVGLAMALDLGWRGIDAVLIEQGDGAIQQPKMDMVNVRTMEFCRRWGLEAHVKAAGFERDLPQDIVYATGVLAHELNRDVRPSIADEPIPPYSPVKRERCPQNFFDPVLLAAAKAQPSVRLLFSHRLMGFEQGPDHVVATVQDLATGETRQITSAYLAACDGAGGRTRGELGISASGRNALGYSNNVLIHSPALSAAIPGRRAYRYVLLDPTGLWGSIVNIDGRDMWRLSLIGGETRQTWSDADVHAAILKAFGAPLPYEVLSAIPWTRRELLADRYHSGRCFLVGDAAHQMSPTGGYGMNTGIGDAVDLSWKLAACLQGWGGEDLLDSYGIERRPVARRAMEEATANLGRMGEAAANPALLDNTSIGVLARKSVGENVAALMSREWLSVGIHMGYRYEGSPICAEEPGPVPAMAVTRYEQIARPGARAPHVTLPDGRSTLDLFGKDFTLLAFSGTGEEGERLLAASQGVPCRLQTLASPQARAAYGADLVLVRPDGHVGWRGDRTPTDPTAVWRRLRGAEPRHAETRATETVTP